MADQVSHLHHFVPKLLLRPWLVEEQPRQMNLLGYWWDSRKSALRVKRKGLDSFCAQLDLLSLAAHDLGRDAIERIFFGEIDSKGSMARDILLASGPSRLTADERSDFCRLLLSLDVRRPVNVTKLREQAAKFALELDTDPEVLAAAKAAGINDTPSSFYESQVGILEDRALVII